jgi:hypothetical protein
MGQAIPRQHPAVVLRSHFNQLRALLVVALIAVAGLTTAVVILANDSDEVSGTSSATPTESINYGSGYVNPSTGYPSATIRPDSPGAGTSSAREQDLRHLRAGGSATETKDEAASAAAIGQSNDGTVTRGSKTDSHGPASLLR